MSARSESSFDASTQSSYSSLSFSLSLNIPSTIVALRFSDSRLSTASASFSGPMGGATSFRAKARMSHSLCTPVYGTAFLWPFLSVTISGSVPMSNWLSADLWASASTRMNLTLGSSAERNSVKAE